MEQKRGTVRVLSWNVFNENEDATRIETCLNTLSPDIAIIQEAVPGHLDVLRKRYANVVTAKDYALKGVACFLAIATNLEISDPLVKTHGDLDKPAPSPLARWMGWAEFLETLSVTVEPVGSQPIRVVNIHTSAAASPSVRAQELSESLDHFRDIDRTVVAGDFNSIATPGLAPILAWPLGYGVRDWAIRERRMLEDRFDREGFTLSAKGVTLPRFRFQTDQIFVRGLPILEGRVVRDLWGSDHRPIIAELGP